MIEPGEAEPGEAGTRQVEVQPADDRESVRLLLEQLRQTSEARFRQFSDQSSLLEGRLMSAGVDAGAEDAAKGVEALREIVASAKTALGGLLRDLGGIERAVIEVPPSEQRKDGFAVDPTAFADAVEARLAVLVPFVGGEIAGTARNQIARFREMIEERNLPDADMILDASFEENFRTLELDIHKTEALMEYLALETSAVPSFLREAPVDLHRRLREGMEHPSFRLEPTFRQFEAYKRDATDLPNPDDIASKYVSERARPAYRVLASIEGPDARRAANQLLSGFYEEAAGSMEALVGRHPDLAALIAGAREAGKEERARADRLAEKARELYDAILDDPEARGRHESLRRRMEREEAFRDGEITAMRPLGSKGDASAVVTGSYSPVWASISHKGKTYEAVVKFDMADRWTRAGVSPGTSSLRETVGALGQVAMGNDRAPAVVSRNTEQYGRVTVMDFVPAESCNVVQEWYLRPDNTLHEDIPMIAARDFLIHRSDGAPRNLLVEDGHLLPIDFGSDFSSPAEREGADYSSSAHFLMEVFRPSAGRELLAFLDRWESSPARRAFEEAVGLLPEDMTGFGESMQDRIGQLRSALGNPPYRFPAYPSDARKDFGKWFLQAVDDARPELQPETAVDNSTFR